MQTIGLVVIALAVLVALAALAGAIQFPNAASKLFASRIHRTVGQIALSNSGSTLNLIQVHSLGATSPPEWIGLTIQNGTFAGSRPITPITLSVSEAKQLSELLAQAVGPAA